MPARLHVGGALRAAHLATTAAVVALLGCGGGGVDEDGGGRATTVRTPAHRAATPPAPRAVMTRKAALRRLRGRQIAVGGRRVALDPSTLTCVGVGPARHRGGTPAWSRFRCVQPTFPPGVTVGPDVVFVAEPSGTRQRLHVRGARLTRY